MTQDWKNTLLAEKSLWQVFKRVPTFWTRKTNALIVSLTILVCALISSLDIYAFYSEEVSPFNIIQTIYTLADTGIDFTLTMLGFLLAGFTIFATITKPELFIELADMRHKTAGMSHLQFIFFSFIGVFVHYLCFLSLCLIVNIGIDQNGDLQSLYEALFNPSEWHSLLLKHFAFCVLTIWFSIVVVTLKSFVWNLYQIFLLSILTEAARLEELENKPKNQCKCCQQAPNL